MEIENSIGEIGWASLTHSLGGPCNTDRLHVTKLYGKTTEYELLI